MERTLLERHDLDWLPPRYRALRWTVAGTVWAGSVGALAALFAATHDSGGAIAAWSNTFAALFAGGYIAGDRAARRVLRGRLQKLAHGAVHPSRLPGEADGELVHVSGRVRSHGQSLTALVDGQPVVWRRAVFSFNQRARLVHEAAVDFWLVGDGGEPIAVESGHGRLLAPEVSPAAYEEGHAVAAALLALVPAALAGRAVPGPRRRRKWKVRVSETVLRDGDRVDILGYKARTVDPSMALRLERDTPYRASLRGGRALPLLVAPRP